MTTHLIESTSSAPTLRERAIGSWEQLQEARDAAERQSRVAELQRKVDVLRMYLRDKIGMFDGDSIQIIATNDVPAGFIVTTADGLRFTLKSRPYVDRSSDRERLHVAVECSRGCGKDLWVNVESLEELGGVLQPDATNMHDFGCLQQFDEDGEPTTDMMGNPLPPPTPAPLTQDQYARQSIAWIENAAQRVARAYDVVSTLEDERALIKPQAIKRLMESGAAASATAAEKIVEADPIYAAHRSRQRDAEIEKWAALASWEQAKLSAALDVALVTVMRNH